MGRKRNQNIVSAHVVREYTPEQVQELVKCINDPIHFIKNYIYIQHPIKGIIPFELYDFQERMIHELRGDKYNLILAGRQCGKTTTVSAYLLWFAFFCPDKLILIVSKNNEGAMELISKIRFMYENVPNWLKPGVVDETFNKHAMGFDNGTRILSTATSEDSGRGLAVSLLYCDEFAFVKPNIQESFWTSISPTLSTGGKCIMSSTPNGSVNLFATLWRKAITNNNSEFTPIRIKWDEVPGRDEAFKKKQIEILGMHKFRQEFLCEFLSSDRLLIDSAILNEMEQRALEPKTKTQKYEFEFWQELQPGKTYLVGVDPSTGSGLDYTVIEIFSFPELQQVGHLRSNVVSSAFCYKALKSLLLLLQSINAKVYFSIENNGIGEGLISLYDADESPPTQAEFISEAGKNRYGMTTSGKTKMKTCLTLKQLVERNAITICSKLVINELQCFIRKGDKFEAQPGATDDTVSSLLIITRLLHEISQFEDAAFNTLYTLPNQQKDDYDITDTPIIVG